MELVAAGRRLLFISLMHTTVGQMPVVAVLNILIAV